MYKWFNNTTLIHISVPYLELTLLLFVMRWKMISHLSRTLCSDSSINYFWVFLVMRQAWASYHLPTCLKQILLKPACRKPKNFKKGKASVCSKPKIDSLEAHLRYPKFLSYCYYYRQYSCDQFQLNKRILGILKFGGSKIFGGHYLHEHWKMKI